MKKTIQKKEEEPLALTAEEFAKAIEKISKSMEVLAASRLKPTTIELLVSRIATVSMKDTHNVIWGLENLAKKYLK